MKTARSFLLVGLIVFGAFALSRAQTRTDGVTSVPPDSQLAPPIQGIPRDISKLPSSTAETSAEIPSAFTSPAPLQTHLHIPVIHAGDRNFDPPTYECAQAILEALNARALVPTPDEKCADMMGEVLELRLRTGE